MALASTMEVIGEAHRRDILDQLRGGEQPVQSLVQKLGLSQPAVSKHLRVLREAGLVDVRPEAQRRMYRLRLEPLLELDLWLEPYRQMWKESLDRLEAHLETMPAINSEES